MGKKLLITILWVVINLTLYVSMMAVDKNGGSQLVFVALRVTLVTSLIMMVLMAFGLVKLEKVK